MEQIDRPNTVLGRVAKRMLDAGASEETVAAYFGIGVPALRGYIAPRVPVAAPGIDLVGIGTRHSVHPLAISAAG